MTNRSLSIDAPAKINLYLRVVAPRDDGYHDIESVFLPVAEVADRLTLTPAADSSIVLRCSDPALPSGDDNLCLRAAHAFRDASGCSRGVLISLHKRIPVAAGLGGGSSDAAAVLLGLNRLHGSPLDGGRLHDIARSLGADVPFFLLCRPCTACGIGDVLRPVALNCELPMVLVNPAFPVPVKWAYSHWDASRCASSASLDAVVGALDRGDAAAAAAAARNDLEAAVFRKFPILELVAESLCAAGALTVRMSGSGPTLFALCDAADRPRLARTLRDEYGDALWVREACVRADAPRGAGERR